MTKLGSVLWLVTAFLTLFTTIEASAHGRVRLQDVQALTLHAGRMTTGRRSAPVPQLKCIGGSAGCSSAQPRVVQCVNRGWDGSSVQWECKAQMDAQYELGGIEVICEGYDYADDPYILQGSCGLEYTVENRAGNHGGSGHDKNNNKGYGWKSDLYSSPEKSSGFGDLLFFVGCGIVIYGLYKTCLAPSGEEAYRQDSTTDDDRPDDGMGPTPNMGWNVPGSGGPSMGFPGPGFPGDSCGARRRQRRSFWNRMGYGGGYGGGLGGGGGGFWSGLATGGMMGYMFGGNRNGGGYTRQGPRHSNTPTSSGLFSSGGFGGSSTSTHESTSFGGTRRR